MKPMKWPQKVSLLQLPKFIERNKKFILLKENRLCIVFRFFHLGYKVFYDLAGNITPKYWWQIRDGANS